MDLKNLFTKWFSCNAWGKKNHLALILMVEISALVGQEVENHIQDSIRVDGACTPK